MKRIFIILFLFLSNFSLVYSQQSITWQRTYGNHYISNPETFGIEVCPGDNDNFYVTSTNPNPNSFNIIKINALGDTVWTRTIDSTRNNYAGFTSSGDGGVVCSGDGAFTVKYDQYGIRVWRKSYGFQALCHKIMRTFDGNYIICGQYGGWFGLIFKINSNGNLIWQRNYNLNYFAGWYNYIIESIDNNYIAVGFRSRTENDTTKGLITKIDTSGNIIWEKEYSLFNKDVTNLISIDKINSGYLVCSQQTEDSLGRFVVDFIKIDESGNLLFAKKFTGENNWNYGASDIKNINENKYLICSNAENLNRDTIITKIFLTDSTGNIIQSRIFNDRDFIKLNRVYIINNRDIIIAGSCDYISPNYSSTLVIRMDSNLYVPPIGIRKLNKNFPSVFKLYQNYPNPFNPTTKIKFEIPSLPLMKGAGGMNVRLIIYDLLGREVATLVNEQLKPGTYEVEWNGSNYASGVYFYKLIAGDFTETKKMVLMK